MGKSIAVKIRQLRLSLGLNQTEFAERFDTTQATVSRWEKGSIPEAKSLLQLAEMSQTNVKSFIDDTPAEGASSTLLNRFEVRGTVAAGVWNPAYEWPEDEWGSYSGGAHIEAPEGTRYGLIVEGPSMNQVYPPGTVLDCVLLEAYGELRSGQRVVVERRRHDGDVEATVKEYVVADDGREWLVPKSYDPAYQAAISARDPGEGVSEVKVVAVVVGSYRPE